MFGVAQIQNHIYLVGGAGLEMHSVTSCESYNIRTNKWSIMPKSADFDEYTFGVSVVVSKKRYLHAVGGLTRFCELPRKEMIRTFDSLRPQSGWRILNLKRPDHSCGSSYGLFPLSQSNDILVFGGVRKSSMDQCLVFSIFLPSHTNGSLKPNKQGLLEAD